MYRHLRSPSRWCRVLAAAACPLLALPLSAQTPAPTQRVLRVVPGTDTSVQQVLHVEPLANPPAHLASPPPVVPAVPQPVEFRVKLAWLSDPVTFPYPLGTELTPQGLAVSGYVPNEAVRRRVVQLAQDQAGVPVMDRMQLHPSLFIRLPAAAAAADLQAQAVELLTGEFPGLAPQLQVTADGKGRVRVAGIVPTEAEQLAVGVCLRRLGGCASVASDMQLPVAVQAVAAEPAAEETPAFILFRPQPLPEGTVSRPGNDVEEGAAAQVRRVVEAVCGDEGRDVRVEELTGRRVEVSLVASSEEAGQRLGPRVVQQLEGVPALAGREVGVRVRVAE
jgi:hypothetical protein